MTSKQPSAAKLKWFKVFAAVLPFLLLALIELVLRAFHYGHDTSLFIRYPDNTDYWVMNKYASERYFSDTSNATMGSIEPFKVEKAANTMRIFVLGESTTAGYPYFHNGSFHRWLQYRLMHTYPDKNFEIINVSLTAVNSYTVLDFGKQVVNYQPDAVLIYTGHNEYYGALGVGSTSHIGSSRFWVQTILNLRKLRLVQFIDNVLAGIKKISTGKVIDQRENLMKRMAASQEIAYNSEEYKEGVKQFETNMSELCSLMHDKNIPVFLSTLVSNERDQKPFISSIGSTNNADQQFKQANTSYSVADYANAKRQYVNAKEYDMLRFRAPEAMNKIIEKFAAQYPNIHLTQTRKVFEEHSPHNILGNETILEHLHPNLYGYALLSEAFYKAIQNAHLIKSPAIKEMPLADLLNQMPITKVDSLYGAYTVMMLEAGWPFNKPIPAGYKRGNSFDEQLAGALAVNRISWADAMNQLFQYSMKANDKKMALKAVEAVMLESPLNITYKIYAGRINFDLGDYENAVYYFKLAYGQDQSFENIRNLYLVLLKTDQPERAKTYIETASRMRPQDTQVPIFLSKVDEIISLKAKLNSTPQDKGLRSQLAQDYHLLAADEAAAKYK